MLHSCVLISGNIAVHLMIESAREKYDLETLWTCGAEFDSRSHDVSDPFVLTEHADDLLDDDHDKLFQELTKAFEKKPTALDESLHDVDSDFRFGETDSKWRQPDNMECSSEDNYSEEAYNELRNDLSSLGLENDGDELEKKPDPHSETLRRFSDPSSGAMLPRDWHGDRSD